jgi:hypothetical protein
VESEGTIRVRPVLLYAPVFYSSDFWSESAHDLEWLTAETPLRYKPTAEFEVSLDVALGEVIHAAYDALGMLPPDGILRGTPARFGFVQEEDAVAGVIRSTSYQWPRTLPVARLDGTIEEVAGSEILCRDLLASSRLGLIEGDVTRPYLQPSVPQGVGGLETEATRLAAEVVTAIYRAVDSDVGTAKHVLQLIRVSIPRITNLVDSTIDEGVRIGALFTFINWLRRKRRMRKG